MTAAAARDFLDDVFWYLTRRMVEASNSGRHFQPWKDYFDARNLVARAIRQLEKHE